MAAREGDAVPLVEPVNLEVVAGLLKELDRKLLWLALDLLHREHVDVFAHEPVDDAGGSGANGVDVPGGNAHVYFLLLHSDCVKSYRNQRVMDTVILT